VNEEKNLNISICMTTYNGELFLSEQLRSILSQIHDGDELIVSDDNSTDSTLEILTEFNNEYGNMHIFSNKENIGVIKNFEKALLHCKNDVIVLSDQDDVWFDTKLDRFRGKFVENSSLMVISNAIIVNEDLNIEFGLIFSEKKKEKFSLMSQVFHNKFIGCCIAFNKELLELALPFPGNISMHDWWLGTCALYIGDVSYIKEPLLYYRRHSSNTSPMKRRDMKIVIKSKIYDIFNICIMMKRRLDLLLRNY